ncbi:MAG TPA: winged helix-turn-helix domain-containing protein [Phenylobacterium sp.]
MELAHAAPFSLGAFAFRPATREVTTPTGTESLEPRVMQVLVALHDAAGAVLTRDELIERCWDGVVVGDDAINRAIGKLRRLSETDGRASFRVENVPRVGFRLVSEAAAGAGAPTPASVSRARRFAPYLGAALVLILVAALIAALSQRPVRSLRDQPAPLVAVLPFDSISPAADDRVLADAITVTLGDLLSRSGLRVISRSSSMEFRGDRKAQAGARLGAQYLIDGDILRQGDRLRLSVHLEDAARHVTIWSSNFEGPADDPSGIERRASAALGSAIAWPGAHMVLTQGSRFDPQAIALFLESSAADKRNDHALALETAHRLIALAPDMPLAQANFAIVTADGMAAIPPADRAKSLADARHAADLAVKLDPRVGEGYVAQSLVTTHGDWGRREALLRKAIDVDADNEVGYVFLHSLLLSLGRSREGMPVIEHARTLDPLAVVFASREATAFAILGDTQAADRLTDEIGQHWPDYKNLGALRFRNAVLANQPGRAQGLLDDPVVGPQLEAPSAIQPLHALVRAMNGRRAADIEAAARACSDPAGIGESASRYCVLILPGLGRLDDVFRLCDRLFPGLRGDSDARADALWLAAPDSEGFAYVLYAPMLAPMRADPRFAGLMERMGFADDWRRTGLWPDFCATEPGSVCGALRRAIRR